MSSSNYLPTYLGSFVLACFVSRTFGATHPPPPTTTTARIRIDNKSPLKVSDADAATTATTKTKATTTTTTAATGISRSPIVDCFPAYPSHHHHQPSHSHFATLFPPVASVNLTPCLTAPPLSAPPPPLRRFQSRRLPFGRTAIRPTRELSTNHDGSSSDSFSQSPPFA
ncbi:hypothetical protein CSUB01_00547 [Colletotrichum sublineola]|uniref:Uncharacterized protein n=1 Tax=Colletotrichum sublineola TaxID=1173701 RepID=A0A066X3V9_COLSU|nr:hypothetical protein CSUB01_00547 [Colletotrichum sublineola]